jgi:HEAT repeat protein
VARAPQGPIKIVDGKATDAKQLRALCRSDPAIGRDLCRQALKEGSKLMQIAALDCLPDVGDSGEAECVGREFYASSRIADVRKAAVRALRRAATDESLEFLVRCLIDHTNIENQYAFECLGAIPHPRTTPRLLAELNALLDPAPKQETRQDPVLARSAGDARMYNCQLIRDILAKRQDPEHRPSVLAFLSALASRPEDHVRAWALHSLTLFDPRERDILPVLQKAVRDPVPEVVSPAFWILQRLTPEVREPVVATLFDILEKEPNYPSRAMALGLLTSGHMDRYGKEVLALLVRLMARRDPEIVRSVDFYLATIGPAARDVLPDLLRFFEEATHPGWMAGWFAKVDPEATVIPQLLDLLKFPRIDTRIATLMALRFYKEKAKAALPQVEALLEDRNPEVQKQAAETLAALQGKNPRG